MSAGEWRSSQAIPSENVPPKRRHGGFIRTYLTTITAATISESSTYPLDITKTRLQVQGEHATRIHNGNQVVYRGMVKTATGIIREEGLLKLWEGLPPAVFRHFIFSGSRMIFYETLRDVLKKNKDGSFSTWKSVIAASLAGGGSQFLASPTDLVKVTMQTEGKRILEGKQKRYKGSIDAMKMLTRQYGVIGLWKGWLPNVQRGVLVTVGDFVSYDTSKHFFMKHFGYGDTIITHSFASICSGFVASLFSTPADVVKTRIMSNPKLYRGSLDCLVQAVKQEGVMSLYKGFIPTWGRLAPWIVIFWVSNEQLRRIVGIEGF